MDLGRGPALWGSPVARLVPDSGLRAGTRPGGDLGLVGSFRGNSSFWINLLGGSQVSTPCGKTEAEGVSRQAQQGKPVVDHRPGRLPSETGLELRNRSAPEVKNYLSEMLNL